MTPPTTHAWQPVLTALTGLRLAIYDDLLRFGSLQYDTLTRDLPAGPAAGALTTLQVAFAWLERHRLIRRGVAEGDWRAVPIAQAAELYQAHGPLATIAQPVAQAVTSTPAPKPATPATAPRRPVQAHQVEIFALDGYKL